MTVGKLLGIGMGIDEPDEPDIMADSLQVTYFQWLHDILSESWLAHSMWVDSNFPTTQVSLFVTNRGQVWLFYCLVSSHPKSAESELIIVHC